MEKQKPNIAKTKTELLQESPSLTSRCTREQEGEELHGIGTETDKLINGTDSKKPKPYSGKKKASSTNSAGLTGGSACRKMQIHLYLSLCTKFKSK